eukprot:TRINITY_DN12007_c0_g1_i1.p1 TRINITY_DN12007_c0_g1~~TRINITY_DN12007_c0_g1_i1.p1  ORF type:complete len:448 (+),score=128.45 TRINITY_DN12007_c0_g1_i1:46-1389(+)
MSGKLDLSGIRKIRQEAQDKQIAEVLEADRRNSLSFDKEPTESAVVNRPDLAHDVTISGSLPIGQGGKKFQARAEVRGPYLIFTPEGAYQEEMLFLVGASVTEFPTGDILVSTEKGGELTLFTSSATTGSGEVTWYRALRHATRNDSRQSGSAARPPASAPPSMRQFSMSDFADVDLIGKGSGGEVLKATEVSTGKDVALKKLNDGMLNHQELQLLMEMDSPFVLRAEAYFTHNDQTYIVMPLLHGGDLGLHLDVSMEFDPSRARFYAAEILVGLDYLHARNIIHRDLKPENAVLDADGHVVLTDMGCARSLNQASRAHTFCGTAEYLAPEIMLNHGYTHSVDHWALGVILYEMLYGNRPFDGDNVCQEIMKCNLEFPPSSVPIDAQELIQSLLQRDVSKRPSSEEIKNHPFFGPIDWDSLKQRDQLPPFAPDLEQVKQWRRETQFD